MDFEVKFVEITANQTTVRPQVPGARRDRQGPLRDGQASEGPRHRPGGRPQADAKAEAVALVDARRVRATRLDASWQHRPGVRAVRERATARRRHYCP